jgi:hypothetical protein
VLPFPENPRAAIVCLMIERPLRRHHATRIPNVRLGPRCCARAFVAVVRCRGQAALTRQPSVRTAGEDCPQCTTGSSSPRGGIGFVETANVAGSSARLPPGDNGRWIGTLAAAVETGR